ncbi:hypothetical protein NLI96_g11078 [Meripilus lineatus]|uniref:Uncharacterized protein n=1 Tax=Meripilus lineatus TaxID=2056292 RepID=A0AAD5UXD5_9APHY|nr:hypothetical protein NLI96_g11078 [Physisporinus lineatus]
MSQETLINPILSEKTLGYVDSSEVDFPLNAATHIVPEFYGPSFDPTLADMYERPTSQPSHFTRVRAIWAKFHNFFMRT